MPNLATRIKTKLDEILAEGHLIIPNQNNAREWFVMRMEELRTLLAEDDKDVLEAPLRHVCCDGHVCCMCGRELTQEENIERVDPYNRDINDDTTLHKICDDCYLICAENRTTGLNDI